MTAIFNKWHCSKCKKEMNRRNLSEILAWGEYVCETCIVTWLHIDIKENGQEATDKRKDF